MDIYVYVFEPANSDTEQFLYSFSKRPAPFLKNKSKTKFISAGGQPPPPFAECPAKNIILFMCSLIN